jgi:hypothetical protein
MSEWGIKIVSGGQTGAACAAFYWAIKNGIPHGGWCPKGRKAEDGPIDARYQLKETPSSHYLQRTEWNARDSDGTVIFSVRKHLSGTSAETMEFAIKHRKPYLHLSAVFKDHAASKLKKWMQQNNIRVLNVAGPRASKEPEVAPFLEPFRFPPLNVAIHNTLSLLMMAHPSPSADYQALSVPCGIKRFGNRCFLRCRAECMLPRAFCGLATMASAMLANAFVDTSFEFSPSRHRCRLGF